MNRKQRTVVATLAAVSASAAFSPGAAQAGPCVDAPDPRLSFCISGGPVADPPIYCLYGGGDVGYVCPPDWDRRRT
jgi:hypothetical protein